MHMNPHNTIFDAKRLIGREIDDPEVQEAISYRPFNVLNVDGKLMIEVTFKNEKKQFLPEEICSVVLKDLKKNTEDFLGKTVTNAVITVPDYFNESQRQAIRDAAKMSGIEILRIINETIAVVYAYGLHKNAIREHNVLIFDLGGSAFNASISSLSPHCLRKCEKNTLLVKPNQN